MAYPGQKPTTDGQLFARPVEVPARCPYCSGAVVRRHIAPGLRCEWRCVRCGRQYGEDERRQR